MSEQEIGKDYELKVRRNPQSLLEEYPRKGNNIQSTHYCAGCGHGIIHKLQNVWMNSESRKDV